MKPKQKKVIRGWIYPVWFERWGRYDRLVIHKRRDGLLIPVEIRPVAAKKRKVK